MLEIATQEFLAKGFAGCSIDGIARAASMSKATIYRHFPSKVALFTAVANYALRRVNEELEHVELDPGQPELSLRRAGEVLLLSGLTPDHREMRRLMVAEAANHPQLVSAMRQQMVEDQLGRLIEFFRILIQQGRVVDDDPVELAIIFGNLVMGGLRHLLLPGSTLEQERHRLERALTFFKNGCFR